MISTANVLRESGFDEISLSTRYVADSTSYARHGITVVPALVKFEERGAAAGPRRVLRFAFAGLLAVILLSVPSVLRGNMRYQEALLRFSPDLASVTGRTTAVIAGGGYLYSSRRWMNLSLLHSLLTIWISRRLACQVIVMPASVGPVERRLDRWLIELACRGLVMTLRERVSLDASRYRPRLTRTQVCPDVAFYGDGQQRQLDGDRRERVIRLVAMDWTWSRSMSAGAMDKYISDMAAIADQLSEHGYSIELGGHSVIPEHGQDDLLVCSEILKRAKFDHCLDENAEVDHLWERYGQISAVVGTRLHSCIMAVSVDTPVVVLAYQEKSMGVMDVAGVPADVFRVDNLNVQHVVDACLRAVSDTARAEVARKASDARLEIRRTLSGANA
jgi:polysaccharide pyruvyl transferase WcaK-like protein